MTREGSHDRLIGRSYRPRHAERRCDERRRRGLLLPYRIASGLVELDRRSHLDRRAEWIRDYVLHDDDLNG
ncbi:MAG: hypothetical protein LBV49_08230 [Azonexus sp.]|jgi:hypothetical protein|nr:hypothetical protein [Azonexus sp.]